MVEKSLGAVANALGCNIVVSDFELQSSYYIHFHIKPWVKLYHYKDGFGIE